MSGFGSVFADLIQKAETVAEPGDYVHDGLLYCGKCRTQKQHRLEIDGVTLLVGCMCRCAETDYEKEQQKLREQERALRVAALRVQGIQDRAMREYTFERAEEGPNIAKCRRYVQNWEEMRRRNCGLLLAGTPGTGKTYAAACIANALISKGIPVLLTSFPKILNSGGFDKTELTNQMKEFELLILDDLGTERRERSGVTNGYALEIVQMVIDERYKTQKPLIITTNLSKSQLDSPENMDYRRIFDRLAEMCVPIHFGGPSRRREKAEDKLRFAKEVLG